MALQFIKNTDANTCSTDSFLDSLYAMEHVDESSPRPPPSPVFRAPGEPYQQPHFAVYNPFIFWDYLYYDERIRVVMYLSYNRSYETYYQFSKHHYKNKNKYFRKQRRIHQPGGSSCDQRR